MILTKPWDANLYNDPWNKRRITDELTIETGTPIRDVEHVDAGSDFPPYGASVQIGCDGDWYQVYSYDPPVTE